MPATVTTLDREIALEERRVGIPTSQPLTDGAIARRRLQIAVVLGASGFVALSAVYLANGVLRVGAVALAIVFGVYAIEKDRHLRRLALLRGDSMRITLVVANELMFSGALAGDRELLDLRDGIGCAATSRCAPSRPTIEACSWSRCGAVTRCSRCSRRCCPRAIVTVRPTSRRPTRTLGARWPLSPRTGNDQ